MNATGAEILAFYSAWPMGDGWYHEHGFIDDEDDHDIETGEEYDLDDAIGVVQWQGAGPAPKTVQIQGIEVRVHPFDDILDLEAAFKAWRSDAVLMSARVPKDQVEAFRALCAERDWEVL